MLGKSYWVCARLSLHKNQDVWVLSLYIVLETQYNIVSVFVKRASSDFSFHLLVAGGETPYIPRGDPCRIFSTRRERNPNRKVFVHSLSIWGRFVLLRSHGVWRGDLGLFGLLRPNGIRLFTLRV